MPYYKRTCTNDKRRRAELSAAEVLNCAERDIRCPECGYMLASAFSDASGHFKIKCQKCKRIFILNFAYFFKLKRRKKCRRTRNTQKTSLN
ncbi:MAG: hypothetical protein IJT36_01405 [Alphaproteobacteria bacterium]|nr:hypothetical protein [Alphaproteobacteria bacterium]